MATMWTWLMASLWQVCRGNAADTRHPSPQSHLWSPTCVVSGTPSRKPATATPSVTKVFLRMIHSLPTSSTMAVTSVSSRQNYAWGGGAVHHHLGLTMPSHPNMMTPPHTYLCAQPQEDEHEEEEDGPEGRDGEQGEGLRVGNEGQSRAVVSHLGDIHTQMIGHEAQDGEDDEASVDAGGAVGDADDDAVPVGRRVRTTSRPVGQGDRSWALTGSSCCGTCCRRPW